MTKEEFFKMRDEQRAKGEIGNYQTEVTEYLLTSDEEERILEAIKNQPHGGIFRTSNLGLTTLLSMQVYKGKTVSCQRKRVDELDNVTVWRNR